MGKNVDQVEEKLLKVVPKEFKLDVHITDPLGVICVRKPRWQLYHRRFVIKEKVYPEN